MQDPSARARKNLKYLTLLAREYPNIAAASSAVRRFFVCFILPAPFSLKKSRAAARLSFLPLYWKLRWTLRQNTWPGVALV